jgi:hypothetical protein
MGINVGNLARDVLADRIRRFSQETTRKLEPQTGQESALPSVWPREPIGNALADVNANTSELLIRTSSLDSIRTNRANFSSDAWGPHCI